jgi:hypothetical protein
MEQIKENRTYIVLANLPEEDSQGFVEYVRQRLVEAARLSISDRVDLAVADRFPPAFSGLRQPLKSLKDCVTTFAKGSTFTEKQWRTILDYAGKYLTKESGPLVREDVKAKTSGGDFVRWGWIKLYQVFAGKRDVFSYAFWELLEDYLDYERGLTEMKPLLCPGCNQIFMQSRPNQLSCSAYCRTVKSRKKR